MGLSAICRLYLRNAGIGPELCLNHTQGLGTADGVAVRYFNYHNNHKIFIDDFKGTWNINSEQAVKLVQNCINNY